MLKSPPLVATLSDSMRMSPCSWGDIFTWPLRGDRIIGLRHTLTKHCTHLGNSRIIIDPNGMRVIARKTLRQFVEKLRGHRDQKAVKSALDAWFYEAVQADWKNPADVRKAYSSASIIGSDRVVFNIKGNDYRLVVAINYRLQIVSLSGWERMRCMTRST